MTKGSDPVDRVVGLASKSPQRRAILEAIGVPFRLLDVEVEEAEDGEPEAAARANALAKARAGAALAEPGEWVLGVDTVVALDGRIWGKPADEAAARATLRALSGRTHTVISGVAAVAGSDERVATEHTQVTFRELGEPMIEWYLRAGEWRGRAGGYAIQGRGGALVRRLDGDYLNVVGLPLSALLDLWPEFAAFLADGTSDS